MFVCMYFFNQNDIWAGFLYDYCAVKAYALLPVAILLHIPPPHASYAYA